MFSNSTLANRHNFTGYIVKITRTETDESHGLATKSLELKQMYKVKRKSSPLYNRGLDFLLAILPAVRLCNHEIYSSYRNQFQQEESFHDKNL